MENEEMNKKRKKAAEKHLEDVKDIFDYYRRMNIEDRLEEITGHYSSIRMFTMEIAKLKYRIDVILHVSGAGPKPPRFPENFSPRLGFAGAESHQDASGGQTQGPAPL